MMIGQRLTGQSQLISPVSGLNAPWFAPSLSASTGRPASDSGVSDDAGDGNSDESDAVSVEAMASDCF